MTAESSHRNILLQLDADIQPSSFDAVVAVDAGVDVLCSYSRVTLDQVEALVHGAIFTRGPDDLHHTAVFIGGTNVSIGEQMLKRVTSSFIGPFSVSVMMDANGSNTTAAAAVLAAGKHLDLGSITALVMAGTGPVGQRAARLLVEQGAVVRLASRSYHRAAEVAAAVKEAVGTAQISPCTTGDNAALADALSGADLVICAGAAGVELLSGEALQAAKSIQVAIDLNAVPPLGIEGVKAVDQGVDLGSIKVYGAIGVGGTKMKIHKAAIRSLFQANDRVLDASEIYKLGESL